MTLDTFSRFTNPSSASLIVVWTTEAFLSTIVVSFLGSVVTIWIITLKSTTTLPLLKCQGTKFVLENSHTVATMINYMVIYRKMENKHNLEGSHFFIILPSMKLKIFPTLVTQL